MVECDDSLLLVLADTTHHYTNLFESLCIKAISLYNKSLIMSKVTYSSPVQITGQDNFKTAHLIRFFTLHVFQLYFMYNFLLYRISPILFSLVATTI